MGNISLALCIPTYERSSFVEDFLVNCSAYYVQAGIDIYYYDSSISDETKNVVCGWPDQNHIHYVRMPSDLHPNVKVYKIFQGYGLKKEYDFIWLSNDGLQSSQAAIAQIVENLKLSYDVIVPNSADYENIGTKVFTDRDEFMKDCAWRMTLFGAAILNWHTVLNHANWVFYENKFLTMPLVYFAHVGFYFCRIAELDGFCALHLSLPGNYMRLSTLKLSSCWHSDFFYVLCESWVQTIEELPNSYIHKKEGCAKFGDLDLLNTNDSFYRFKESGLYSLKVFLKYRHIWDKVTSQPRRRLLCAALLPKGVVSLYYRIREKYILERLKRFCNTYSRIIIYGAGTEGNIYAKFLDKHGIYYDAFCVTHRKQEKTEYLRHPIYELAELMQNLEGTGFIIAMTENNAKEVVSMLQEKADHAIIFYKPAFNRDVRQGIGYTM